MDIKDILKEFQGIAEHPYIQLKKYKDQGKKIIGVLPYYAPEELVYAAGMVPFGIWGSNNKSEMKSKEYCASFYCTIVQLALEMYLDGTFDCLDGIITPTICDSLRPMSQNFKVACEKQGKAPVIFLAHPQNRKPEFGIRFCMDQYNEVKEKLENIAGKKIDNDLANEAIIVYNKNRAEKRRFSKLAADHCDLVNPIERSAVFKASYFMLKDEHTKLLKQLNDELEKQPKASWTGKKVVTSGIICDNPKLLQIFVDNNIAIAADDVAHESRMIRVDAKEDTPDAVRALAEQFAAQDFDILLYDEQSSKNRRGEFVANLVKESGASGLVLFMQQFCDPEEMEYPSLKKALSDAGVPHIKLGIDQQMRDFGQAATALEAFAEII